MTNDLMLLAINLTKRCNLACEHCYLDADTLKNGGKNELSTQEVTTILDKIASRSNETMIVLTGGEPLLRKDLETIVEHGAKLGFAMVLGSNGTLLTEQRVLSLKKAGLMGAGISIDSLKPENHNRFRGQAGSWQKSMRGIDLCNKHDLPFQLHFSITKQNRHELNDMVAFAKSINAKVLNLFFLICTGRGEQMSDLTPEEYDESIKEIIQQQQKEQSLIIRPRCAPYYKRIAYQNDTESKLNSISGQQGDGCIAGTHYCRITPTGGVTPCPYIEEPVASTRKLDFLTIWDNAPAFTALRANELTGKCGKCEYKKLCGGCRARPVAAGGKLTDEDLWCNYQPTGKAVIEPFVNTQTITWDDDAQKKLQRIPGFLRSMIRKRAEAYVLDLGESTVQKQHLTQLANKRFGKKLPFSRPASLSKK